VTFLFQGEKGAKGDPGPMGLPVSIYNKIILFKKKTPTWNHNFYPLTVMYTHTHTHTHRQTDRQRSLFEQSVGILQNMI